MAATPFSCDACLISDPRHLAYLAGYAPDPFTFRTASGGALLVIVPGRSILIGDNLLKPFLEAGFADEVRAPTWYDGTRSAGSRPELLCQAALHALLEIRPTRLGIEGASVPLGLIDALREECPVVELVELDPTLRELRRAKDPDEVETLRTAIRAAEAGLEAIRREARSGMTEIDAFRVIDRAASDHLGGRTYIYGDFVSGPELRGRLGPPTARVLRPGDILLLDFSVIVRGYRGDFAVTLHIGEVPDSELARWHAGVLASIGAGEALLQPGRPCREVDRAIRRSLAESGLDPNSPGHLGHGIGLDHPEAPFIVPYSEDVLREGDVLTLEPGQYGPPYGGLRLERNYRITAGGFEMLSGHDLGL
ncbi:MAG: Xaa-Pro peptidase family protein [Isosphaeraceae bacterium]